MRVGYNSVLPNQRVYPDGAGLPIGHLHTELLPWSALFFLLRMVPRLECPGNCAVM